MNVEDNHKDKHFMRRALALAEKGKGNVSPNPLVGCVIVCNDRIIGEGWHEQYGGAHAEVNAVANVNEKNLLAEATVYVNLEPCSHYGKTPPCAEMLVKHKVRRVVIANQDSNPLVGGKGIARLKAADIEVDCGILESDGRRLNERFFTFIEKKRPYVILKWAETTDGFISRENYDSRWISNTYSRQLVHKWRAEEDAILVGTQTAGHDNPALNVRDWTGRNPIRIVLDRNLRLDNTLNLFDGTQLTICYNTIKEEQLGLLNFVKVTKENYLNDILQDLYHRNIQSVIVEGGAQTLNLFIESRCWDEARIFVSKQQFSKGINAPVLKGNLTVQESVMDDLLKTYRRD